MGQGAFFLATGVWPLISMRTFEKMTGPKTDDWLVKTVGVSVGVTGATLMTGALRGHVKPELFVLGAGSAFALGAVDVAYVAKGTISPIYLADAAAESAFVAGWLLLYARRGPARR
jgi:hypothetical protein